MKLQTQPRNTLSLAAGCLQFNSSPVEDNFFSLRGLIHITRRRRRVAAGTGIKRSSRRRRTTEPALLALHRKTWPPRPPIDSGWRPRSALHRSRMRSRTGGRRSGRVTSHFRNGATTDTRARAAEGNAARMKDCGQTRRRRTTNRAQVCGIMNSPDCPLIPFRARALRERAAAAAKPTNHRTKRGGH